MFAAQTPESSCAFFPNVPGRIMTGEPIHNNNNLPRASPFAARLAGLGKSRNGKRFVLILALLAYASFGQGMRGLWQPDEGRYTCVALNMLDSGDWLHPRLSRDLPHFTKPPLTYWALAASFKVFGRHEWAARLPYTLAFAGTVLLILALGPRLAPRRPRLAALIYASSPLVYLAANTVTTDTLLAFWETLAMYAFVEWWHRNDAGNRRKWLWLMWTALGLAFMTKGPPGLLPLCPMLAFVWMGRDRRLLYRMFPLAGLALFMATGLTWYLVVIVSDPSLLGYFAGEEVLGRVATGQHHRNDQWYGAFLIYIPTLLLGALPWIVPLFKEWREAFRQRRFGLKFSEWRSKPESLLLLLWFWLPLLVFFLARSRLPLYVLPLFAPLSLLLARQYEGVALWRGHRRWLIAGWVALLLSTRVAGGLATHHKDSRALAEAIRSQTKGISREILFVKAKPYYGLKFYLDAEVRRVKAAMRQEIQIVEESFAETQAGRLFVVNRDDLDKLLRADPPPGCVWRQRGDYDEWLFYVIEQSTPRAEIAE
jgi:4-amino-4-deoxy-L-arabinose transferase-like glycosyltransferase